MLQRFFYNSKLASVIVNFVLILASVLIAMSMAEAVFRAAHGGEHFNVENAYGFFPRFYHRPESVNGYDITPNFPPTELIHHDYIKMSGAPYTVSSNDLGCRDRDIVPGSRYVLLLGDSFTWANVPIEEAFGSVLEQLSGVRILKCGVSGYGTHHEHHKLKQVLKHVGSPSLIILGYYVGNDLIDDYLYPEYTVVDGYLVTKVTLLDEKSNIREKRIYTEDELREQIRQHLPNPSANNLSSLKDYLIRHSYLYNVLRNRAELRRLAFKLGLSDAPAPAATQKRAAEVFRSLDDYPWLREAWNLHFDNLRGLKKTADDWNLQLLIVLIPSREQVYEFLRPPADRLDWEYPNKRLAQFFKSEGIHFLDLLPELRKHANLQPRPMLDPVKDLYWRYDYHLNVKGNRIAGLLIGRHLLEQSMIDVLDSDRRLSDIKQLLNASTDAPMPPPVRSAK